MASLGSKKNQKKKPKIAVTMKKKTTKKKTIPKQIAQLYCTVDKNK